jgi:hypothetical protein
MPPAAELAGVNFDVVLALPARDQIGSCLRCLLCHMPRFL